MVIDPAEPDFATLYSSSSGACLTPRMACALWLTAGELADLWADSLDDPEPLLHELPIIARPVADGTWLTRFVRCFEDLAGRVGEGLPNPFLLARCTGDEMALHLVIGLAEAHQQDGMLEGYPLFDLLPESLGDDFEAARDVLFQDFDILYLFVLPSTASTTSTTRQQATCESRTFTRDWFEPF